MSFFLFVHYYAIEIKCEHILIEALHEYDFPRACCNTKLVHADSLTETTDRSASDTCVNVSYNQYANMQLPAFKCRICLSRCLAANTLILSKKK